MLKDHHTLLELSDYLGAELKGDPECLITGIAPLDKAIAGQISFLHDRKYRKFLETTQASALIISPKDVAGCAANMLVMDNPYLGYAKTAALFLRKAAVKPGIHPTAVIGEGCTIAASATVGAHCVLGDRVTVGEGSVIHAGCTLGDDSVLGAGCLLWSKVTLYHNVKIEDRVIVHSGAVIGSDGFGLVNDKGIWHKIPQLGGVTIGNDVEIGANTTIDRGALEDTVIEDGVKLDNQIQIAHNVRIGAHTAIAGCTGIAGSTRIGKYCMIGGGVSINGHIEITDQVILTGGAGVMSSITEPGVYSSAWPLQKNREWRKTSVRVMQLDDIARRLRQLERDKA